MTFTLTDIRAIRGRSFSDWREIVAFCREVAAHREAIVAERRLFGYIQDFYIGMEC